MNTTLGDHWLSTNQRLLSEAVARVRQRLKRYVEQLHTGEITGIDEQRIPDGDSHDLDLTVESPQCALDHLATTFGLSSFERDLLVLCAGAELDAAIPALCARALGDPQRSFPTFGLALAALPGAHWSAVAPNGPLRRWSMVEFASSHGVTGSALRIDERILNYLLGIQHLDERLVGLTRLVTPPDGLIPSHDRVAEKIASAWGNLAAADLPVIFLRTDDTTSAMAVASLACQQLSLALHTIAADALPASPADLERFVRLWEREAVLSGSALLMTAGDPDHDERARAASGKALVDRMRAPLIVSGQQRPDSGERSIVTLDVGKPEREEQIDVWQQALAGAGPRLNGQIARVATQFNLDVASIAAAGADLRGRIEQASDVEAGALIWEASRVQARPGLDDLAQRIDPVAGWDDLVLPGPQRQTLREIAIHVRQRTTVYEQWGFAAKGARGLGISALFAGPSGTGKTMAAEVLANEFHLDLYRIDLSSVVSKYIGETEKNLRKVFDAAETGGAILLFDEADALFGKRSEVKDSHDRYANIEVGYLLQRMEAYRGLAILTTNLRHALDTAFLRRIRFIVQFPFPDAALRAEIWRRVYPPGVPVAGLDYVALARLNVTGGTIRNIALNAAFLAAESGDPVSMTHLLNAARSEYAKLEKTLTDAETGGWV